jgi:hypothetical protein
MVKSWILAGSTDGQIWRMIDRQTDSQDFRPEWNTASFAISNPMACRFIRLTQTDGNHLGQHDLALMAVEFFGTLSE